MPGCWTRSILDLKKGEFLYVVGGSGAGKSSLLRLLATEEAPTSGAVSLFGYNIAAGCSRDAQRDPPNRWVTSRRTCG